jgi:hypothetical protein
MKAGEFSSVREAAREAGIIKDVSLVNQVLRLWEKATPEERQAIRQGMEDSMPAAAQAQRGRPSLSSWSGRGGLGKN